MIQRTYDNVGSFCTTLCIKWRFPKITGSTGPIGPIGVPLALNFSITPTQFTVVPVSCVDLVFTFVDNMTIQLRIRPRLPFTSVLVDSRRFSFSGATAAAEAHDNLTLTGDGIVASPNILTESNDFQKSWLRQQNPDTGKWSLCEYSVFGSNGSERITVWINWIFRDLELL